jgi:hypothetical protein
MPELLLSPSQIKLFGSEFAELALNFPPAQDPVGKKPLGSNNFLYEQLVTPGARLARIYAFAYEGDLFFLPKPYIFLVHGDGNLLIQPSRYNNGSADWEEAVRTGATVDRWGVAKIDRFGDDVRVWGYDKEDFSLRIDVMSGPLSELALEPAMVGDSPTARADMSSGADSDSDMAARAHLAVRHRFSR